MTIDKTGSISRHSNRPEDQAIRDRQNEKTAENSRPENTDAVRSSIKAESSEASQDAARADRAAEIGRAVNSGTYGQKSEDVAAVLLRDLF